MLNCTRLKNQCTTPFEFSKRSHYVNQTLPSVYLSVPASRWKHERRELMVCVQKCTKDSELCKLFSPSQISVLFFGCFSSWPLSSVFSSGITSVWLCSFISYRCWSWAVRIWWWDALSGPVRFLETLRIAIESSSLPNERCDTYSINTCVHQQRMSVFHN